MNDLKDQFRYLVGGYYGMCLMDEYPLKEFILQDIKVYIENFIEINGSTFCSCREEALDVKDNVSDRVKLQDLVLVLHKINASIELELMVKAKLRSLGRSENF